MGAEPIDYNDPELSDRVRLIAPRGVDAVFDHLGGPSFERSFKLLAPGGTLVAYGVATQKDDTSNMLITFLGMEGRLTMWSLAPNGCRALFYNFWTGKHIRPKRFWLRLASDPTSVLSLLAEGAITPHVAARMPLAEAGTAMTLAKWTWVHDEIHGNWWRHAGLRGTDRHDAGDTLGAGWPADQGVRYGLRSRTAGRLAG